MSLLDQAQQRIDAAAARAAGMLRRGLLLLEENYFLGVEANDGEAYNDVELWQQFGLSSRPPAGGEVLLALVGGRGEGAIAVATTDRAHRPTGLSAGDSALHSSKSAGNQAQVTARASGDVEILPAGAGNTCDIGASPTDYMLLGTIFNTSLGIYLAAMNTAAGVWDASPKATSDVNTFLDALSAASKTFFTAQNAGIPPGSAFLATKGRIL